MPAESEAQESDQVTHSHKYLTLEQPWLWSHDIRDPNRPT